MYRTILISLTLLAITAGTAQADLTNLRPYNGIQSGPDALSLQGVLDSITTSGHIDAVADQSNRAVFTYTAASPLATFVVSLTNRTGNEFGIYKYGDSSVKAMLFDDDSANVADQVTVKFFADNSVQVWDGANQVSSVTNFGRNFGFYLNVPTWNETWYTEDELNNGAAQALVYQGDGSTQVQIGNLGAGTFWTNDWILAFEQGPLAQSDKDFNDMVVYVQSLQATVPAPGAALLGFIGLGIVGWVKRRLA
jgi:hypothetical protein